VAQTALHEVYCPPARADLTWRVSIARPSVIKFFARLPAVRDSLTRSDRTMSHAALLSESGMVIVLAGGTLAYGGDRYFENQDTVERVAGFLLIAGLACIGVSLGLMLYSPFP
jgi:hypothetical protein